MNHERICSWLGLPTGVWPPDHYRLLGIAPGSGDPAQIESHVFERMETVRRYQLQDPELATEAMNRLAQAFVCLTNPESKKTYDAQFLVPPPTRRRVSSPVLPVSPPLLNDVELPDDLKLEEIGRHSDSDPLAWMYGAGGEENKAPPESVNLLEEHPVQVTPESPTTLIDALDTLTELTSLPVKNRQETRSSSFEDIEGPPRRVDPIVEAARSSQAAKRGLHTKRSLYHRIAKTRVLLRAWNEAGEYMGDPERRLTKPVEATELIYLLGTIRSQLKKFPPLLGKAGQAGYLVVALARQQVIVPTYQTLLPSQRETLARDWVAGQKLLAAHRDFLRVELRLMRRRSLPARVVRVTRHFVGAHPGMILLVLAMVALGVALWRTVYLGANGFESFKVVKKEEGRSLPAPTQSTPRKETKPKKIETPKATEGPSENLKPDPLPESDKKEEGKDSEVEKPSQAPISEQPAPNKVSDKKSENPNELVVQVKRPVVAENSYLFAIRGLAFAADKRASNPQFFASNPLYITLGEIDGTSYSSLGMTPKFKEEVTVLVGCPHSFRVSFGCDDGKVFLYEKRQSINEATELIATKHERSSVRCLAFSPRGLWLASGGQDGKIHLYEIKPNKLRKVLNSPCGDPTALAFLSERPTPFLVSGYTDGTLCLWDRNSGKLSQKIQAHEKAISSLVSSPDDNTIASGGDDGSVQLWKMASLYGFQGIMPRQVLLKALGKPIKCLAFSSDSRYLLIGFGEGHKNFEIRDIKNKQIVINQEMSNDIEKAVFSPDGKGLLVGDIDGFITYYTLPKFMEAGGKDVK